MHARYVKQPGWTLVRLMRGNLVTRVASPGFAGMWSSDKKLESKFRYGAKYAITASIFS